MLQRTVQLTGRDASQRRLYTLDIGKKAHMCILQRTHCGEKDNVALYKYAHNERKQEMQRDNVECIDRDANTIISA